MLCLACSDDVPQICRAASVHLPLKELNHEPSIYCSFLILDNVECHSTTIDCILNDLFIFRNILGCFRDIKLQYLVGLSSSYNISKRRHPLPALPKKPIEKWKNIWHPKGDLNSKIKSFIIEDLFEKLIFDELSTHLLFLT